MAVLVQDELEVLSGSGKGARHQVGLLGADVEVVHAVDDQRRAVDLACVDRVVEPRPDIVVIAVGGLLILGELPEEGGVVVVDDRPVVVQEGRAAVEGSQAVRVIRGEVDRRALGVGVIVPGGDAREGDDGLEPLHAGGGHLEGQGAAVGAARHGDIAVGPVRRDLYIIIRIGVGHAVPREPFHHAGVGVPLKVEAAELIALGAVGADAARLHHGKAPDKIVVIGLGVDVSGHP